MEDVSMWSYWRMDNGVQTALEEYYPELLKSDQLLGIAHAQLKMAILAIDHRMEELDVQTNKS